MNCSNCGVSVTSEAKFCQSCGHLLDQNSTSLLLDVDSKIESGQLNSKSKLKTMESIRNGKAKLLKVFWIYNVLADLVLVIVAKFFGAIELSRESHGHGSRWFALFVGIVEMLVVAYVIWALLMLWRNAYNTSWRGWGHMARGYVVYFIVMFFITVATIIYPIVKG